MKILALVTHTLRELSAKATLIVLAGISTVVILGTAAAVSSAETPEGISLQIFGKQASPPVSAENFANLISTMQAGLASGLFTGVILFGLFATAGVIPDTLEKGTVDLYLSKPLARWELLLGRSLGAIAAVFLNFFFFIAAIWLLFGIKLGVWNHSVLVAVLTLTFIFASLFAIVAFLGVLSRSMAISIIGAFLYLLIIGSVLENRERSLYWISENQVYRGLIDGIYYLLPQISAMLDNVTRQQIKGAGMDWKPFAQSLLSAGLIFTGAVGILRKRDF